MATIRKAYADTSAGQMHFRTVDCLEESGAPVLFFHRTPVTSASFDRVLSHLAGSRRLIAFDTPGFGESFTPPAEAGMDGFIGAFSEAIDALGINEFHLVGHHTGAHFASELAILHPHRALSLMIDGAMVPSAEERAASVPPAPATVIDQAGAYAAAAWNFLLPYYTVFDEACIHDEFVGALRSIFTRGACMRVVSKHEMTSALKGVSCPILASAAEDDVFVGHLARIAEVAPQALLRTYGPAGIASPELQTEAFCRLVSESIGHAEG